MLPDPRGTADIRALSLLPGEPVRSRRTIASLIVIAASMLDREGRGGVFTFEQLLRKMRELLDPNLTLDVADVQAVLPDMGDYLAKARGGWRWKRRSRSRGGQPSRRLSGGS